MSGVIIEAFAFAFTFMGWNAIAILAFGTGYSLPVL